MQCVALGAKCGVQLTWEDTAFLLWRERSIVQREAADFSARTMIGSPTANGRAARAGRALAGRRVLPCWLLPDARQAHEGEQQNKEEARKCRDNMPWAAFSQRSLPLWPGKAPLTTLPEHNHGRNGEEEEAGESK